MEFGKAAGVKNRYGKVASKIAALLCVCGLAAQAFAAPPDEAEEAELAAWNANTDRVQALPAFQWLNANRYSGTTTSLDHAVVEFVGYFAPEDLTHELLAQLQEGPLTPGLFVPGVPFESFGPIRVARFPVPGHPGRECAALIQVRVQKDNPAAAQEAERVVASYAHHLPQRPLTSSCREGPPPPLQAGFTERIEIKRFGPLLIEPERPCSAFPPAKIGTISIASDTRIDNRRIVVGDDGWFRTGRPDLDYHAARHFDFFMRGFQSYFYRNDFKAMVRYDYGNYAPRPQDIIVELRVIEDQQADAFCYVADINQGNASQRFVRSVPRQGRALPWHAAQVSLPIYDPGKSLIDWGTDIAARVLEESGR